MSLYSKIFLNKSKISTLKHLRHAFRFEGIESSLKREKEKVKHPTVPQSSSRWLKSIH